jgi:hypothetical protein
MEVGRNCAGSMFAWDQAMSSEHATTDLEASMADHRSTGKMHQIWTVLARMSGRM